MKGQKGPDLFDREQRLDSCWNRGNGMDLRQLHSCSATILLEAVLNSFVVPLANLASPVEDENLDENIIDKIVDLCGGARGFLRNLMPKEYTDEGTRRL